MSVVYGVLPSFIIILLLVIAIIIAVVCVKRNHHKQQSSDSHNVEMDEYYNHPTTKSIYNSVNNIDYDPTSSEQQIHHFHLFENVSYGVQPARPNITVWQSSFYPHDNMSQLISAKIVVYYLQSNSNILFI